MADYLHGYILVAKPPIPFYQQPLLLIVSLRH